MTTLADIIGINNTTRPDPATPPDDPAWQPWRRQLDAERTVSFAETPNGLIIEEACDHYFGTTLTADELANLIRYLTEQHTRITQNETPRSTP